MTFWVVGISWSQRCIGRFQSLFYWNDLLSPANAASAALPRCFNPCSIGMTFWVSLRAFISPTQYRFNPCSIGMTFWVRRSCTAGKVCWRVSILVLLEWPSEYLRSAEHHVYIEYMFQSLFYWNDLLSKVNALSRIRHGSRFNPCSIGMTFWVLTGYYTDWVQMRFNPCSIGMTFWVSEEGEWYSVPWEFQSLFYWNDLLSEGPTSEKVGGPGFQSLFYWNDLLSYTRVDYLAVVNWFQSLFYWNDLLSLWNCAKCRVHRVFQSLFYWNDLLSCQFPRWRDLSFRSFNPCSIGMTFWVPKISWTLGARMGFQSLFYWNDLLSPTAYRLDASQCRVSILVLLEWPSEYGLDARTGSGKLFQSLFYWNDLLSNRVSENRETYLSLFQSLFYWNDLLSC